MKKILLLATIVFCFSVKAQVSTFSFNITGSVPAGFTTALVVAGQKWSNYLQITVPVKVNVFAVNSNLLPFSAITVANGRQNFANAPLPNILYTTSLANQLAGVETNASEFDMDIYFNLYTNYYFGTGKPSASQTDFISTAMHEIGHGLGFYSDGYVNSSNVGSFGNIPPSALAPLTASFPWHGQDGVPSVYDLHIIKQSNSYLTTLAPNNTNALGDSIKNNANYFNGPLYSNASHSNTPVRLSGGTGAFSLGVDLLHIHNSYPNTIMSYYWGAGDTVRIPAPWELGILKEIGWNLKLVGIKENSNDVMIAASYPNPANTDFYVRAKNMSEVQVYTIQNELVQSKVNALKEEEVEIDSRNLNDGIYFLKIYFSGTNQTVTRKIIISH